MSPLVALNRHAGQRVPRQLSGAKRTPTVRTVAAAFDPKRTFVFVLAIWFLVIKILDDLTFVIAQDLHA